MQVQTQPINYLISFALPRFCEQTLTGSRKQEFYPGAEPWIAKLDTIVHELYHIDPNQPGIRRVERSDGAYAHHSHSPDFFVQVARMVKEYLATRPDPATYDFLRSDFAGLSACYGGVVCDHVPIVSVVPAAVHRSDAAATGRRRQKSTGSTSNR